MRIAQRLFSFKSLPFIIILDNEINSPISFSSMSYILVLILKSASTLTAPSFINGEISLSNRAQVNSTFFLQGYKPFFSLNPN